MLDRLEQRNREVWEGHPRILEDVTHVLAGIGLGLLLFPILRRQHKLLGYGFILISTALHLYADTVKPARSPIGRRMQRLTEEMIQP